MVCSVLPRPCDDQPCRHRDWTHHLVREDAVETVAIQLIEPGDALELIIAQLGAADHLWLADLVDLRVRQRVDAALRDGVEVLRGSDERRNLRRTASSITSARASVLGAVAAFRRDPALALCCSSIGLAAGSDGPASG